MLNNLTAEQKNILISMAGVIELASDIAHAHISIYVPDTNPKLLRVYSCAKPLTQFVQHREVDDGREVRLAEEPLIARSLQRNIEVVGMREYAIGLFAHIKVYPIRDMRNRCFAVAAFDSKEPAAIFSDTAFTLLRNASRENSNNTCYRRLSSIDGLMLVNDQKVVIGANNTAKHIFQVLGVGCLIGKRTTSLDINWPMVGYVLDSGVADEKELGMQGLTLKLRFLPMVPRPKSKGVIIVVEDITELKKKDEELLVKSVVIKEIHHRVKNNLQTIASLLRLQQRRARGEETKEVLRDCINRVNSIAVVHEYLSQQDSGLINVAEVAKGIYNAIMSSMVAPDLQLETSFRADAAAVSSEKATSIALVLNELLQNSLEHGFENKTRGTLEVSLTVHKDQYELTVEDDGCGLPEGFALEKSKSLGLKIIQTMVESDLRGSFSLENNKKGGLTARVRVPKK